MSRLINIAIDGYAGSGKSTLAKALARRIGYKFVDTGALYRAATYLISDEEPEKNELITQVLKDNSISFNSENHVLLNGDDIESIIRGKSVSDRVSKVAAVPEVRAGLLQIQKDLIQEKGVVMEGRDIGTVIMPDAELKLFITADFEVRAQRRLLQAGGSEKITLNEVRQNLEKRDRIDCNREEAPLSVARDAIVIDNTNVSFEELLKFCEALVAPKVNSDLLPHLFVEAS